VRRILGRGVWGATLFLALTAGIGRAQTRPEPRLIFSIFGGVALHGNLWQIDKQPLLQTFGPVVWDTLRLTRTVASGPTVGLSATLYRGAHLGFTAEAQYFSLKLDDTCVLLFENPDSQSRNAQVCEGITAQSRTASVVAFTVGVADRFAVRSAFVPFVHVQAGITSRSSSLLYTAGVFQQVEPDVTTGELTTVLYNRVVIEDLGRTTLNPTAGAGLGFMWAIAPGYQLRMELRDHILVLSKATGPANDNGVVSSTSVLQHSPALIFGFDIVLEQRRGRRY
jgi:hypothetical protein